MTEIIETEETIEDRMAILEMSQFKIQSMQMKKDLTDLAIKKLVRTKNYEESGSRWRKKLTEWKETEELTRLMIEADQLKKLDVTKKRKEDQEKEEDHIEVIYEKLCDQGKKVKGCYKVFDVQRQYSEHIEARRTHGNICPERIECITIG